mgnify:CR=1 FL=1|tara:strand:- start:114 stop:350 length:237 start_codon:yes stop_codon:yes gene_type:complete
MINSLNLSLEDSDVRDLFSEKEPGDEMILKVKVELGEINDDSLTAHIVSVDGKVTDSGSLTKSPDKVPSLEVMRGKAG